MEFKDYFEILELKRNANFEEIKLAYRKLSKKYHPDVNEGDTSAHEKFIKIQAAYKSLTRIHERNQQIANFGFANYHPENLQTGTDLNHFKLLNNKKPFIPENKTRYHTAIAVVVMFLSTMAGLYYYTSNREPAPSASNAELTRVPFTESDSEFTSNFNKNVSEAINDSSSKPENDNLTTPEKIIEGAKQTPQTNGAFTPVMTAHKEVVNFMFPFIEDYLSIKSHNALVSVFGADAVQKSNYVSTAGVSMKCSVLHTNDKKIVFVWEDEKGYQKIKFLKAELDNQNKQFVKSNARLYIKQRVYLGMSLKALQELNENPVYFYGWGSGNGGNVAPSKKGQIDLGNISVNLSCENCGKKYLTNEKFSSQDSTVSAERIFVSGITIPG